ncbi:MAG: class B sortase [Oscillospiraceae bacterium]|nr:class B sortase [Oscillospiraceae bacterium]
MEPKVKKCISFVLLVVFLVSTALLLRNVLGYGGGNADYSDAAELARPGVSQETEPTRETVAVTVPTEAPEEPVLVWVPAPLETEDPKMEKLKETDLDALRKVNEDILGWIHIPSSKIDYPLLQGEDNEYYLKRTWKGHRNPVGSIFLECRNNPDFTDWHTIIYGHNMSDGSMFATLHRYKKQDYWEKHPYIYIVTDAGVLRYEVFSTYTAKVDSKTYGLSFRQMETREEFLAMTLEKSQIDTGIVPAVTDQILTLSTCGGGDESRRVVHARMPMVQVELQ